MQIALNKKGIAQYFMLFILLLYHGAIFFKVNQDWFYIGVLLLFALNYGLKLWHNPSMSRKIMYAFGGLLASLLLTTLTTGGSLGFASILNIYASFALVYMTYDCDRKMVCTRYVNLVTFMAALSLVLFAIQCTNADLLKDFLGAVKSGNQTYYGGVFYTIAPGQTLRNVGMFAEPGLYQIVLNVNAFILLFMGEKLELSQTRKLVALIITIVTLITAQSTTGYIGFIIVIGFFLLEKNKKSSRSYVKWIILATAIFLVWDLSKDTDGLIYKNVIEKLFNQEGALDLTVSSGGARYYSMLADLAIAVRNPLGVGYENYSQLWRSYLLSPIADVASCCGLTYALAAIGWISTFWILGIYIYLMRINYTSWYMRLAYIVMFINLSLGQPSIRFPAMMLVLLVNCRSQDATEMDSLPDMGRVIRQGF